MDWFFITALALILTLAVVRFLDSCGEIRIHQRRTETERYNDPPTIPQLKISLEKET